MQSGHCAGVGAAGEEAGGPAEADTQAAGPDDQPRPAASHQAAAAPNNTTQSCLRWPVLWVYQINLSKINILNVSIRQSVTSTEVCKLK